MGEEFDLFYKRISHYRLPLFLLKYLPEHRRELEELLSEVDERDHPWHDMDYLDFVEAITDSISCSILVLSKQALERYCVDVHDGHDRDASNIRKYCPDFVLKCEEGGNEFHVVRLVKYLRDRFIHSRSRYNKIKCNMKPLEVLNQELIVRECIDPSRGECSGFMKVHFCPEGSKKGIEEVYLDMKCSGKEIWYYGELLTDTLIECVRKYDEMRTSDFQGIDRVSPYECIEYE